MFVTQDKFNAVVSERDKAVEQSTLLQTQLEAKEAEANKAKADLEATAKNVEDLQSSLTSKDAEIANLKAENAKLKELPGANTTTIVTETEVIDNGEVDHDAAMLNMSIAERMEYRAKNNLK